jgi:Tol biopolymer transport system component
MRRVIRSRADVVFVCTMLPSRWSISGASVVAILITLTAGRAAPGAATPDRWIVFSAHPNGGVTGQLFRVRTSGNELEQITSGAKPATAPDFSPDGTQIVFVRLGSGIFRVNLDGTSLRRLTSNVRDASPVWSPDGKRIAFLRPYSAQWRVYVMSASGGAARRLPKAPPAGRPSWTANGKSILIPSGGDLVKVDARTGTVQKYYGMTIDVQISQTATASPDARLLAYVGPRRSTGPPDCGEGRCPQFGLYLASIPPPHRPRRIANDTGPAGWSPDGRSLVYVARGALTIRPVGGGALTTIATGSEVAAGDSPPAWQPR